MSGEKLFQQVIFDPEHLGKYIAVREERLSDGRVGGVLIAHGLDYDQVHAAIKKDRQERNDAVYHFYTPICANNTREGKVIGKRLGE